MALEDHLLSLVKGVKAAAESMATTVEKVVEEIRKDNKPAEKPAEAPKKGEPANIEDLPEKTLFQYHGVFFRKCAAPTDNMRTWVVAGRDFVFHKETFLAEMVGAGGDIPRMVLFVKGIQVTPLA